MRGVGPDGFHRDVVRENFVVRIKDQPALAVNNLLVNVFLCSESGIFVMFDCLQIDQAKRKNTEQRYKDSAHESATSSATWIHVAAEGLLPVGSRLHR